MKNLNKICESLRCYFIAPVILLGLCGCSSLLKPVIAQIPNVSASTNFLSVVTQTNFVSVTNGVSQTNVVLATNFVPQVVLTTNVVTTTNAYVVNPSLTTGLASAQAVVSATAPFDPYAPLATGVLALLSGGLAYYAKVKTNQAQTHASAASTIITAIEGLASPTAQVVKDAVKSKSAQMGTANEVNQVVSDVTKNL